MVTSFDNSSNKIAKRKVATSQLSYDLAILGLRFVERNKLFPGKF